VSSRRILVVTTVPVPGDRLRTELGARGEGDDVEVRVISPASDVSRLEWLANDEDEARAEAGRRAEQTARSADANIVDAGVGDPDPLKAIEDALREWPADEVVVITPPQDQANWLESDAPSARERFGIPVAHLKLSPSGSTA
jgi:hypothetical protein